VPALTVIEAGEKAKLAIVIAEEELTGAFGVAIGVSVGVFPYPVGDVVAEHAVRVINVEKITTISKCLARYNKFFFTSILHKNCE
jgi:hypothetical protein